MRNTQLVVDLNALKHNYNLIKNKTKKNIIGVVKANGYGCGAYECSKVLIEEGVLMLAVAYIDEAIELRQKGITHPILVMGYTSLEDVDLAIEYNLTIVMHSLDFAKNLDIQSPLHFHLKIDTGMNRLGLKNLEEIKEVLEIVQANSNIILDGIYTHYATADSNYVEYKKQSERFEHILNEINFDFKYIHTSNSAATLMYDESFTNTVRPGLALYGFSPNEIDFGLKEIASLYSEVALIKHLKSNESVSYGYTYTATTDEIIALIPIGYADGFIRGNQNGDVAINNKRYPIVGRICMDQMLVKVDESIQLHDPVELVGPNISADEVANRLTTINYEVICTIGKRVKREYVEG